MNGRSYGARGNRSSNSHYWLNKKHGKKSARNKDRTGHRTQRNGKGDDTHSGAQGHGGRIKPNFKIYKTGKRVPKNGER